MYNSFYQKSFLKLLDFTGEDIDRLVDLAIDLKKRKMNDIPHRLCEGKNIALIFEKTSTRTRCAFEVAAADLGMHSVYLDPAASQIGKKESIADTAAVLGGMFDAIEYRGYGQERVETLAKYSGVPVYNGLTDEFHPTQILADLMTIKEHFGTYKGKKLVFMGDAKNNMGNSLMVGAALTGMNFTACSPEKYFPDRALVETCLEKAKKSGSVISFETDPLKAVSGADVIYTDVWVSMGEDPSVWEERIRELSPYAVTQSLMNAAGEGCVFMHCLPAFHDLETSIGKEIYERFGLTSMEVSDEVFSSDRSIVFQEAHNRMHTIKAVIAATISKNI